MSFPGMVMYILLGKAYCYQNVKNNAGVTPLHSACE